jgi:hypothetical protein
MKKLQLYLETSVWNFELAHKYIAEGALPQNKLEDAVHAATATVFEMDALISWNLKHLSNLKKMEMVGGFR